MEQDGLSTDINYPSIPDWTGWSLKEMDKKFRWPPLDVRLYSCVKQNLCLK